MIAEGKTNRLILRPVELGDAAQIQRLFPHWEIVRYLQNVVPWPYPEDGALTFLRDIALPAIARGEQWVWTLRLRDNPDQVIGIPNLRRGEQNNRGFWLALEWQGKGLMSEACVWANGFWFETLGFSVLRVAKAAENLASRRISKRQGMRLIGIQEKDYVCGRLPSEVWEITALEWEEWKSAVTEYLFSMVHARAHSPCDAACLRACSGRPWHGVVWRKRQPIVRRKDAHALDQPIR